MLGLNGSTQVRANDELCACCIAEHIDGRRGPKTMALAAGVLLVIDCGVKVGVGNGPKRARDGNEGVRVSRSGFGSRKRGTW
jgi:hypothetical protein